jgi:hypothetical protein
VQLGAFRHPALVEAELGRIDRSYPLLIESSGTAEAPLYRILIGPMSEGESGAVLRQVRGLGFPDAFLRR